MEHPALRSGVVTPNDSALLERDDLFSVTTTDGISARPTLSPSEETLREAGLMNTYFLLEARPRAFADEAVRSASTLARAIGAPAARPPFTRNARARGDRRPRRRTCRGCVPSEGAGCPPRARASGTVAESRFRVSRSRGSATDSGFESLSWTGASRNATEARSAGPRRLSARSFRRPALVASTICSATSTRGHSLPASAITSERRGCTRIREREWSMRPVECTA